MALAPCNWYHNNNTWIMLGSFFKQKKKNEKHISGANAMLHTWARSIQRIRIVRIRAFALRFTHDVVCTVHCVHDEAMIINWILKAKRLKTLFLCTHDSLLFMIWASELTVHENLGTLLHARWAALAAFIFWFFILHVNCTLAYGSRESGLFRFPHFHFVGRFRFHIFRKFRLSLSSVDIFIFFMSHSE